MIIFTPTAFFENKEDGGRFPNPPSYSVATTLPSYDEAERSKAEAAVPLVTGRVSVRFLFSDTSLTKTCSSCSFRMKQVNGSFWNERWLLQDEDFVARDDFEDADQLRIGNDGIFMLTFFSKIKHMILVVYWFAYSYGQWTVSRNVSCMKSLTSATLTLQTFL